MILILLQILSIDVYYEAMCIDSVDFVSKQLIPVYENLNKHINVTFIPFALGNVRKTIEIPIM